MRIALIALWCWLVYSDEDATYLLQSRVAKALSSTADSDAQNQSACLVKHGIRAGFDCGGQPGYLSILNGMNYFKFAAQSDWDQYNKHYMCGLISLQHAVPVCCPEECKGWDSAPPEDLSTSAGQNACLRRLDEHWNTNCDCIGEGGKLNLALTQCNHKYEVRDVCCRTQCGTGPRPTTTTTTTLSDSDAQQACLNKYNTGHSGFPNFDCDGKGTRRKIVSKLMCSSYQEVYKWCCVEQCKALLNPPLAPTTTVTMTTTTTPTTTASTASTTPPPSLPLPSPPSPGGQIEDGKCIGTEDVSEGTAVADSPCFSADTGFGPDFSCATTEMWCGNDSGDGLVVGQCCPRKCKAECENKNKKGNEESRTKSERERKAKRSADESARKSAENERKKKKKQDEWQNKRDSQKETNEKKEDENKDKNNWAEKKRKNERKWKKALKDRKAKANERERTRKQERGNKESKNKNGQSNNQSERDRKEKRKKKQANFGSDQKKKKERNKEKRQKKKERRGGR